MVIKSWSQSPSGAIRRLWTPALRWGGRHGSTHPGRQNSASPWSLLAPSLATGGITPLISWKKSWFLYPSRSHSASPLGRGKSTQYPAVRHARVLETPQKITKRCFQQHCSRRIHRQQQPLERCVPVQAQHMFREIYLLYFFTSSVQNDHVRKEHSRQTFPMTLLKIYFPADMSSLASWPASSSTAQGLLQRRSWELDFYYPLRGTNHRLHEFQK